MADFLLLFFFPFSSEITFKFFIIISPKVKWIGMMNTKPGRPIYDDQCIGQ